MGPRTKLLASMLMGCCPFASGTELVAARAAPIAPQLRSIEGASLEQQVAALQKQVAALQNQLKALLTVLQVTESGVVLQGHVVTIAGATINVRSDGNLALRALDLKSDVGGNTTLRSGSLMTVSSSGGTTLHSNGPVDVKGSLVRLNNGSRPVAVAGSPVQTANGTGQVVTGSATVLAD